ncbi:MAG: alkaline phosphatase [Bacteroidales bacterium]|nr:alkaline phosphatase [Bacteroidales bacterium]
MKNKFIILTLLALSVLAVNDCFAAKWKAKHVVLIGLDGWSSACLDSVDMPNVREAMKKGAFTLKKRSVLPSSSAVNWASMFMGAGPELHGYTEWGSKTPELPSRVIDNFGIFPNIWGLVRKYNKDAEIGYIYEWDGMSYLVDKDAMNYMKETDKQEKNYSPVTSKLACDYIINKKPNFLGIIFDNPDETGHAKGWESKDYYSKVEELDKYIGEIINATKKAGIYDNTIFIITADHGGINMGHGGKTMKEMETPFIVFGKNIKQLPDFEESMMQFDVAATIAYIFNTPMPQVWIGRPMKQIFK